MPESCLPAACIPVSNFRQILTWPLLIQGPQGRSEIEVAAAVTSKLKGYGWEWPDESLKGQAAPLQQRPGYGEDQHYDYSEIVYFHSYVRDFLYGGDGLNAKSRPMRVFHRTDLHSLRVKLDAVREYTLNVKRLEAYLFTMGVLLLVVDVELPNVSPDDTHTRAQSQAFHLSDALNLQNVLRMAFPRRWERLQTEPQKKLHEGDEDGTECLSEAKWKPKETPLRACWLDKNGNEIADSVQDFTDIEHFTRIVREEAELPAARHLTYLVRPFALYGQHQPDEFAVKQIEDQRLPSMTYLAVPDPRQISEWDFARIAFFDSSGESSVGSYSDEFLADWAKEYAYDRFWQRIPSAGGNKVAEHNNTMRTRWLCSGYGFSVVGASEDHFFTGQIAANFRHHYFRMGLIAHFHRATLLMFRDQLAEATVQFQATSKVFRPRIMKIQQDMTRFRARYWFREVSTQLQGQEIFAWWSERLGNPALFEQVAADIAAADAQVRTEFESQENAKINAITYIGGVIGALSIFLSAASLIVPLLEADHCAMGIGLVNLSPDSWIWACWQTAIVSPIVVVAIAGIWIIYSLAIFFHKLCRRCFG